ncbi:MAG TPA: hypothetical protein VEA61_15370 [Allosphingosinicella sp.]|nr:hypothetical protein [Allosphingosinicella sp.]
MGIKLIFASTAALALAAAVPAFAAKSQNDQRAAASGGAGAKAKDERKTCRFYDNTASRMKRERLCLTREQWKKFEAEQAQP